MAFSLVAFKQLYLIRETTNVLTSKFSTLYLLTFISQNNSRLDYLKNYLIDNLRDYFNYLI